MEVKELKSKGLKREFSITIGVDDLKEKKIKNFKILLQKQKLMGLDLEKSLLLILKNFTGKVLWLR